MPDHCNYNRGGSQAKEKQTNYWHSTAIPSESCVSQEDRGILLRIEGFGARRCAGDNNMSSLLGYFTNIRSYWVNLRCLSFLSFLADNTQH